MLKHTVTTTDVKTLYERLKPRGSRDAFMGLRTEVHEALQAQLPPPYSDHPAHLPKDFSRPFTTEELSQIRAHQLAQVTEAEMVASEKARATGDGTHADAHHYVQKQHGLALWAETDRIIREAGITEGCAL